MRDAGIRASTRYHLWESAIEAGATLDELLELDQGTKYPGWFKASLIAFVNQKGLVKLHIQDAALSKSKAKAKRKS